MAFLFSFSLPSVASFIALCGHMVPGFSLRSCLPSWTQARGMKPSLSMGYDEEGGARVVA